MNVLTQIKSWMIVKLGGITKNQMENQRAEAMIQCEMWVIKYLVNKKSKVAPDSVVHQPCYGSDVVIVRSNTGIIDCVVKSVNIAPWCKQVRLSGVSTIGVNKP